MIKVWLVVLLAVVCGLFPACNSTDGWTEIPNELTGKEFIAGKGPAADAEVRLIPVGFIPGGQQVYSDVSPAQFVAMTDEQGRFAFKDIPPGQYNILASQGSLHSFRDSLGVTGKGQVLNTDTLDAPASLTGRVELEPGDDPQSVTVQLMGTTRSVNVNADGTFHFKDLGAGEYRLRVVSILNLYVPLYKEATILAAQNLILPQPLRPYYTGIPVVRGMSAAPDSQGSIRLKWNKTPFTKALAYLIFRDNQGALLPSLAPLYRVTDTVFSDTIYSGNPRPSHYPYDDTAAHSFSYRVKILDQSGNVGPSFGFTNATSIPPTSIPPTSFASSGVWKRMRNNLPISDTTPPSYSSSGIPCLPSPR